MDVHTKQERSYNMSRIKGKDTKPERVVRSMLHRMGYRFRLHRKDLPGKPDIVLPKHRKVIEVRGCYWHMHDCKYGRVVPKTNTEFWQSKRTTTVERDKRNEKQLVELGWSLLVVWECMTRDAEALWERLADFMNQ